MQNGTVEIQPPLGGLNRRLSYQKGGLDVYSSPDCLNVRPDNVGEKRQCLGTRGGLSKWAMESLGKIQSLAELSYLKDSTVDPDIPLDEWLDDFRAYPFTSVADQALSSLWQAAAWDDAVNVKPLILNRPDQIIAGTAGGESMTVVVQGQVTSAAINTGLARYYEMLLTPIGGRWAGTHTIYALLDNATPDPAVEGLTVTLEYNLATQNVFDATWEYNVGSSAVFSGSGTVTVPGTATKPLLLRIAVTKNTDPTKIDITGTLDGVTLGFTSNTALTASANVRWGLGLSAIDEGAGSAIGWYRVRYTSTASSEKPLRPLVGIQDGKVFMEYGANQVHAYTQQYCNTTAPLEIVERGQKLFIADYGPTLVSGSSDSTGLGQISITITNRALTSNVVTLTATGTDLNQRLNIGQRINVALSPTDPVFDGSFVVLDIPTSTTLTYARTNADVTTAATTGTASKITVNAAEFTTSADVSGADKNQYAVEIINVTDTTKNGIYYLTGVDTHVLYFDQELGRAGDQVTFRVFRAPKVFDPVTGLVTIWRAAAAEEGPHSVIVSRQVVDGIVTLVLVRALQAQVGDLITVASNPPCLAFDGTYPISSINGATVTYARTVASTVTNKVRVTGQLCTLTFDPAGGTHGFVKGDRIFVALNPADAKYDGEHVVTATTPADVTYHGGTGTQSSTPTGGTVIYSKLIQSNSVVTMKGRNALNTAQINAAPQNSWGGFVVDDLVMIALNPPDPIYDAAYTDAADTRVTVTGIENKSVFHFTTQQTPEAITPQVPTDGTATLFTGTAAITPKNRKGFVPPDCTLLTRCQDRMLLAAPTTDEQIYFFSRQGDPFDWDYGADPTDVQRAVAGETGPAGVVAQPIRSVAAWVDDLVVFGCISEMWVLTGEIAMSARLDKLSPNLGSIGPRSWCFTPTGDIVTLSRDGLYLFQKDPRATGSFNPPMSLSYEKMPRELTNLSKELYSVSLVYDQIRRGIQIFVTPLVARPNTLSFFFDMENKGFWPFTISNSLLPLCAVMHGDADPLQSDVMLGCKDGFLRRFSSLSANDDGTAFKSYAVIGPMRLSGNSIRAGMIQNLVGVLSIKSGDVLVTVSAGTSEEQVLRMADNTASTVWKGLVLARLSSTGINDLHYVDVGNGGQQPAWRPRLRGGSFAIKIEDNQGLPWSLESCAAEIADGGRARYL